MIVLPKAMAQRSPACLPLPVVLLRAGVFALTLLFVLVLVRSGYNAATCLMLVAGSGVASIHVSAGLSRGLRIVPAVQ